MNISNTIRRNVLDDQDIAHVTVINSITLSRFSTLSRGDPFLLVKNLFRLQKPIQALEKRNAITLTPNRVMTSQVSIRVFLLTTNQGTGARLVLTAGNQKLTRGRVPDQSLMSSFVQRIKAMGNTFLA